MPWGLECAPAARRIKAAIKEDIPTISFSVLITSLVGLFLLLGTGFFAVRARLVPMSGFDPLVSLLMKIALPATVFTSLIRPFEADFLLDGATIFVLGLVTFSLFSALSLGLSRVLRIPKERRGTWSFCASFANCGFIGYPVAYALFGDEGLSLAVLFGAAFNFLCYTLGAALVRMDAAGEARGGGAGWREVLCTPINGSILLGMVFYCGQIPVPEVLMTPLEHLANLTTPLSMFVTGMSLAQGKIAEHIRDREAILASAVRLLACPVLAWLLMLPMPIENEMVVSVALVLTAMPTAAAATILAQEYGGNIQLGVRSIFLSSILSIVTIPLVSLLL